MNKSKKYDLQKQNFLIHTILTNSREKSRRKLKSLHSDKIDSTEQKRKINDRYTDIDNHIEHIELPTFGDWKSQINQYRNRNSMRNSIENQKNLQVPKHCLSQQQKIKETQTVQQYKNIKIQELIDKTKQKQPKPLNAIDNIMIKKFCGEQKQVTRKLTQRTLPSKKRTLSKQFYSNLETIDNNAQKTINKKQLFKLLYLKQKQKYEEILRKHNIDQKVDDTEFQTYFGL